MGLHNTLTSKLSTLDGAQKIFYIVAGLAIKESLSFMSGQTKGHEELVKLPLFEAAKWIIGLGYLATALRFCHGVALLYGHETETVKNWALPSSSPLRIFRLAVFMSTLAILLYLMAENILAPSAYLALAFALFFVDCVFIVQSRVVRGVWHGPGALWHNTSAGFLSRAAVQWMFSDIGLSAMSVLLLSASVLYYDFAYPLLGLSAASSYAPDFQLAVLTIYGAVLLIATALDYWVNSDFYFGGKKERRSCSFVYVCSPLRGDEGDHNIRRAQWYCKGLMEAPTSMLRRAITPFAADAFFTYFLNDNVEKERILRRRCSVAYLSACDAIYVYVDYQLNCGFWKLLRKRVPDEKSISTGMRFEIDEAKKLGLEIRYLERTSPCDGWSPSSPGALPKAEEHGSGSRYVDTPLKRVFVCTPFHGQRRPGDTKIDTKILQKNFQITLQCCRDLVLDKERYGASVAPFAPQVFYPVFWSFLRKDGTEDPAQVETWFIRSLEVLKLCDAVYLYTVDGLPDPESMSDGQKEVRNLAVSLGLECTYFGLPKLRPDWERSAPEFLKSLLSNEEDGQF